MSKYVLEYITVAQDGRALGSIQFDTDLECLETALHNYEVCNIWMKNNVVCIYVEYNMSVV